MNHSRQVGEPEQDAARQVQEEETSEEPARVFGDSPVGSLTSHSSSSRQERVVELLPKPSDSNDNNERQDEYWQIAQGFYDEDVAAVDHPIPEEDRSEDEDENSELDESDSWVGDLVEHYYLEQSDGENFDDEAYINHVINYDITLPISHQYLGNNLEEARGREILVDNSIITLPLMNLQTVVLLPGQVLPLLTKNLNPRITMYLKAYIARGTCLIGLISEPHTNSIGTTAEIRKYNLTHDDELRIIIEGRQRFEMLSPPFEATVEGRVRILPEMTLGRPYTLTPSRSRFLLNESMNRTRVIVSRLPQWLLRQYEVTYIVNKIHEQISNWFIVTPPSDPIEFSYWVAANLSISNDERIRVLNFSCNEERLLWLMKLLEESENLGCSTCKNVICHKTDVWPMSCNGPQNSFVNEHGYVHDTITVRFAGGLIQDQVFTRENSWFPGYSWRVAHCAICRQHIGWCYNTETDSIPRRFYGLSRMNVRMQPARVQVVESPAVTPNIE